MKVKIELAAKNLQDNNVILMQTDTVYGLCSLINEDAIKKIIDIKKDLQKKKVLALFLKTCQ